MDEIIEAESNLWEEVGNECLRCALTALNENKIPTAATVGIVKELVQTAIEIDSLSLRRSDQNRSGAAGFAGPEPLRRESINPEALMRKVFRSAIGDIQRASRAQGQETSGR